MCGGACCSGTDSQIVDKGVGATEKLAQPEKKDKHEKHNSPPKHDTAITLKEESHESNSGRTAKEKESTSKKDSSNSSSESGGGLEILPSLQIRTIFEVGIE